MTTFYCLRVETPPTWRARSPYLCHPGTEWPDFTPRHWVPFSSPPTTRRAAVEVLDTASTQESVLIAYIPFNRDYIYIYMRCSGKMFAESLHINGRLFWLSGIMSHVPSSKLLVPVTLQGYPQFLRGGTNIHTQQGDLKSLLLDK
jgi:hypothetical protein